ncbi:MAG: RNA methyltransferase [Candidatus Krumholzibacteria bacterium]|nr:RNA methyltransferase [Candidatus Krumholzibacteria bacterium]
MKITSTSNSRIRSIIKLSRRSERVKTGLMPVEGIREVSRALEAGVEFRETCYCPEIADGMQEKELLDQLAAAGAQMTEVSSHVFGKIAYRESVGGIIAIAVRRDHPLEDLPSGGNPLLLVVDHLEKPGNLGAIFRSADGAGATGVIVSDPSSEISNPNVIRASLGTVFSVPKAVAPAPDVIAWLKAHGIAIAATTPDAETAWSEIDLASPSAIVLGSEDRGLSDEWLKAADVRVKIPMRGIADSLNVSAAAAILLYEALRQRLRSG